MGTQNNRLTETILLSTHNIGLDGQIMILEHAKRPLSRALRSQIKELKFYENDFTGLEVFELSFRIV